MFYNDIFKMETCNWAYDNCKSSWRICPSGIILWLVSLPKYKAVTKNYLWKLRYCLKLSDSTCTDLSNIHYYNPEYLVIWHLLGPVGTRLKEFCCTILQMFVISDWLLFDSFSFPVIFQTVLFALVWSKLMKLSPWCRVLEKLTCSQLVKKFPEFYRTQKFITAFTRACHLSIFWARPMQSMPPHPTSWRSILILTLYICHATISYWQRIKTNLLHCSSYLLVTSVTCFSLI